MVFVTPAFSMVRYRDPVFGMSICSSICSSVYFCIIPNFDHSVQVNFLRTIKATVMILGISLHLGMTTQAAVAICDLNLFFTFHQLCKFAWHNIAFRIILVNSLFPFWDIEALVRFQCLLLCQLQIRGISRYILFLFRCKNICVVGIH